MAIDVSSGALSVIRQELRLPGRIPLKWERQYNSSLVTADSTPLGRGWGSDSFMSLARVAGGFRVTNGDGSTELIPDRDGLVDDGGVVRAFRTFRELARVGGEYVLTQWSVLSETIRRFVFVFPPGSSTGLLRRIENASEDVLDFERDASGRLSSITQRHEQRAVVLHYDAAGLVVRVELRTAAGTTYPVAAYAYTPSGQLERATDARGSVERYEYDARLRLKREVAKDGDVFYFMYDHRDRCVRTSGLGHYDEKTLRFIDAAGWTEVVNSHGHVTRYQWLPSGQILQVIDARGGRHLTTYDDLGRVVAQRDAVGNVKRFAYDEQGNRALAIDAAGGEYRMVFNERHQPVEQVTPAGGVWKRHYDDRFRLVAIEDPCRLRWDFAYDAAGNLSQITIDGATLTWQFGAYGRLQASVDPLGYRTEYECDDVGRVTAITNPEGGRRSREYDRTGLLVAERGADGTWTRYSYDLAGNVAGVADGSGHVVRYRHGTCGRLLEILDDDVRLARFEWGTEPGEVVRVHNARGEVYQFERDENGRVVSEIGFDGRRLRYEYDAVGNMIARTNAQQQTLRYTPDPLGRTLAIAIADGGQASYTYDRSGNIALATNATSELAFERDPVGRITKAVQNGVAVEYSYTPAGKPRRTRTALGLTVDYEFDRRGLLSRLHVNESLDVEIRRNRLGAEVERVLPGRILQSQTIDAAGRLLEQYVAMVDTFGRPAERSLARSYSWNGATVVAVRDEVRSWSATFNYDAREQVTQAFVSHVGAEAYRYDDHGNILAARRGDGTIDFEYGAGDRLARANDVLYRTDEDGRLRTKGVVEADGSLRDVWTYEWDALDQLIAVTNPRGQRWTYHYDAFGRRTRKTAPDGSVVSYTWDRDVVVHEQSARDGVTTWLFDDRTFKAMGTLQRGTWLSVISDHVGAARELVDQAGEVVWAAAYDVWGAAEQRSARGAKCPLRFQGQWHDEESGLYYTRHRYYDPELGRFISPDPIGLRGGFNAYRYAPNPVNWIDPYGLDWNYVLVNPQNATAENPNGVYYSGVAADNARPSAVEYRHGNNVGNDGDARFDPARGDRLVPVTPAGTDHETARGLEQRLASDFDTVIGRQGSEGNNVNGGSVRGNNQNPVDPNGDNATSRAAAAEAFLGEKGKTTGDLVDDGVTEKDKKDKQAAATCDSGG